MRALGVVALCIVVVTSCSSVDTETPRDAAVWVSQDASAWKRVRDPALAGAGEQQMTSVSCGRSVVVAGGSEIVDGEREAAIWLSEDGANWQRVYDPDLGGSGEQWIWDVTNTGSGLIAVGSSGPSSDQDAAIWISRDGSDWSRVDGAPIFGGRGTQIATAVASLGDQIAVVGQDSGDAAVWTSADGRSWSRLRDPELEVDGYQGMAFVAVTDTGLIAAGDSDNDAAVWIYDGSVWSRSNDDADLGGHGRQAMTDLAAIDGGIVAVGNEYMYDEIFLRGGSRGTFDGAVWITNDMRDWTRLQEADAFEGVGEQTVSAVIEWNGGLLAVGYDLAGRGTVEEGGLPYGSGEDVDASVWLSSDGWSWAKVESPEFGGDDWQDMYDVADCPGVGLVAVGGDDLGTPPA